MNGPQPARQAARGPRCGAHAADRESCPPQGPAPAAPHESPGRRGRLTINHTHSPVPAYL
jgi:hypothetical protein